uniref:Uncharacterized protein n=1 Tax=Anopheles albimanus TaxID=7167 RepID=A0A182FYJ3_ANOAL
SGIDLANQSGSIADRNRSLWKEGPVQPYLCEALCYVTCKLIGGPD